MVEDRVVTWLSWDMCSSSRLWSSSFLVTYFSDILVTSSSSLLLLLSWSKFKASYDRMCPGPLLKVHGMVALVASLLPPAPVPASCSCLLAAPAPATPSLPPPVRPGTHCQADSARLSADTGPVHPSQGAGAGAGGAQPPSCRLLARSCPAPGELLRPPSPPLQAFPSLPPLTE